MPFQKHCCPSLITEDHTDHCLSRQAEIALRQAEIAQVTVEWDDARREIERYREALEHAMSVLYRIGNERRTDDAHKISAHVEHVRISRVLHGLHPTRNDSEDD